MALYIFKIRQERVGYRTTSVSDHVKTSKFEKRESMATNACCVQVTQLELHIYMYLKKKKRNDGISKVLLRENRDGDKEERN